MVANKEIINKHKLTISTIAILYKSFFGVFDIDVNGP
jgi:hypothetical protein